MQALEIDAFGGPEVLQFKNLPVPEPGPGEILVKNAYAGVNFHDIYRRQGDYANSPTYPTKLPVRLGIEASGIVTKIGPGVTDFAVGDRVAYTRTQGTYAEYFVTSANLAAKIPAGVGLDQAGAVLAQGITAHYLTHSAYPLKAGESCLIHAGAGGVGQLAIQIAKMRGARVFATVGSAEKAAIARARGADEVILYREVDFRAAVMKATAGRGVDVVYDSVGQETFLRSLNSLRPRGFCILFGHTSGQVESIHPLDLSEAGSVFVTRPHMAHYILTRDEFLARAGDVLGWVASGRLHVTIDKVYPMAQVADAHRYLSGRQTKGKVLLEVFGGK